MSYIEEHCLIFDNEEENKLEYTTIHMVSKTTSPPPVIPRFGHKTLNTITFAFDRVSINLLQLLELFQDD